MSGSQQTNENEGDYEMSEDMMSEMANEIQGRINGQESENDKNEDDETNKTMNLNNQQLQSSLNQLRSTGSPNSTLAQMFNKSTLAAMGLDQQNNAAALAATLATLSNYGGSMNPLANSGPLPGQTVNKPKPPALARVSCQICRKELCNKYFLKSHLLNAHHITADDLYMNNLL